MKLYKHQQVALDNTKELNRVAIWKDIKGYEGLYQASDLGSIRSLITNQSRRNTILKACNNHEYRRVNLYKDMKVKKYYVHRLVAKSFIPNPNNYPEINHIDGDKANNIISNLEWCTSSQNQIHAFKTGLQKPNSERFKGNNFRGITCELINNITNEIIEFKNMIEVSEYLGHYKTFIYRKSKISGNPFISDGYTVKVGDAKCQK